MRTMMLVALVMTMVTGCAGQVVGADPATATAAASTPDACSASASPETCDQCVAHAPRGLAGAAICESVSGRPGDACCATTQADGSCVATYFDGVREVSAPCAPVGP